MTAVDCNQFTGRKRDICRGHDDAGNPVLTPERCEAYRRRWAGLPPLVAPTGKPGTELKNILAWFRQESDASCQCAARAAEMDRNGVAWCEQNIDTIVGWLLEVWDRKGMGLADFLPPRYQRWAPRLLSQLSERSVAAWGARRAVRLAIRRTRKNA